MVLATVVAAAPAQAKAPKLQSALDAIVAGGAPGAVMVVHSPGRTLRLASGLADRDAGVPMRPGMHVRIASVTKTYTAAVVLQLVGERKLRLRDSVQRWLPGLVPNGRNITVRQLLGHTSGLGDFEFDPACSRPTWPATSATMAAAQARRDRRRAAGVLPAGHRTSRTRTPTTCCSA